MIAFLGTRLLGSNFVKAFIKKGNQVHVWNRTGSKAKALEASGAKAFDEPWEAVRGAERIHLTSSDDLAVDSILEKASAGFEPGVIIIASYNDFCVGRCPSHGVLEGKGLYLHCMRQSLWDPPMRWTVPVICLFQETRTLLKN